MKHLPAGPTPIGLTGRQVGLSILVAWACYVVTQFLTPATNLIEVMNGPTFAIALGISIAYMPSLQALASKDVLDRAEASALSICVTWFVIAAFTGEPIVWRAFGYPAGFLSQDVTGSLRFFQVLAGMLHWVAWATDSPEGIPPVRWVKAGVFVAVSAMLAFALMLARGLL